MPVTQKARLAVEIVLAYGRARLQLRRQALPGVVRALRPNGGAASAADVAAAARLGRATERLLRTLPGDTRCLTRSLVLTQLLDRRRIASALVIGVQPGESFGAHAWVEVAGHPVLASGGSEFARLVEL